MDPETGTMPDAFADQVRQTLENVWTILEAAGSSTEDVVKVNAYVTDLTRFAEFNDVYKVFSRADPPARTTVVAALLGILVEVDCIAAISSKDREHYRGERSQGGGEGLAGPNPESAADRTRSGRSRRALGPARARGLPLQLGYRPIDNREAWDEARGRAVRRPRPESW